MNCLFMPLKPKVTQINVKSPLHNLLWGGKEGRGTKGEKWLSKIHLGGAFYSSLADKPAERKINNEALLSVPACRFSVTGLSVQHGNY